MTNITDVILRILEPNNLVLLVSLIIILVISYMIIKKLTSVLIISVFSGGFFALLNYFNITGLEISITNVLGFMVLGTILYVFFTVVFITTNFFRKVLKMMKELFIIITAPIKSFLRKIGKKIDEMSQKKIKEEKKEKSVILEESGD